MLVYTSYNYYDLAYTIDGIVFEEVYKILHKDSLPYNQQYMPYFLVHSPEQHTSDKRMDPLVLHHEQGHHSHSMISQED